MKVRKESKKILGNPSMEGYLTVWLTMVIAALLPLFLTLVEGARSGGIRLESEIAMDVAMNSCFAEYHRELFRKYHLLAIDCSYGSDQASTSRTAQHLQSYLAGNLDTGDVALSGLLYRDFLGIKEKEATVDGVVFLTDGEGEVFRRRAAESVQYDTGVAELQSLMGLFQSAERSSLFGGQTADTISAILADLDPERPVISEILTLSGAGDSQKKQSLLKKLFPERKTLGFLDHLIEDDENLSQRELVSADLVGERIRKGRVNLGNMRLAEKEGLEASMEPFLFLFYLQKHFSSFTDRDQGDALAYQMEYLLAGKDSDMANLKKVLTELVILRSCLDYSALHSDPKLRGEAEALALLISIAILNPEAEGGIREALMLIWGIAEGYHDVRILLDGGKVPLLKENDNWYYGNLKNMIFGSDTGKSSTDRGMDYEQYLLGLLLMGNRQEETLRAMNLVEAEVRRTPGNGRFRLDACIDTMKASATVESCYGYRLRMERTMDYQ